MKNTLALGILIAVALVIWAAETVAKRWMALMILIVAALLLILAFRVASARDDGQWDAADPTAICQCSRLCSAFGNLVMKRAASSRVTI